MYIRCPNCKKLNDAKSSDFGKKFICQQCSASFILNTDSLPHFELPETIRIILPKRMPDIRVIVEYGYRLPPLKSNDEGQIIITRAMFAKAQNDAQKDKADYSLGRFVTISIPSKEKLTQLAYERKNSGWPILAFEKELYSDFDKLLKVYFTNINDIIKPCSHRIDLEENKQEVELIINS